MLDTAQNETVDHLTIGIRAIPGERNAVISPGRTLCYSEFDGAVNHMAEALRGCGVERDECIPVIVPRSPELVVAIHGIIRAGAAYVPIDPDHPPLRNRTIIAECGARIIVAGAEYAQLAAELGVRRIEPTIAESGPVEPTASPDDLIYVIYTSGSTGLPKGVEIEHRSVVNRLRWMQHRYALGPDDVILQKTPVTFDVSVWELLWWAMVGASVALLEPGGERDPRKIVAAIRRHRVTVMHFVPSMLGPFLDELDDDPDSLPHLSSLRTVFCSGEALTPALVERFNRVFGPVGVPRLVNLYGPTEATVDVSYFDCPSAGPVEIVPIGRPIDNTQLLVLDDCGNPCPVGVPGELNIAGVGLARGYRGRPALTAQAFARDPRVAAGRRYRTGDLARWRADGNLEFLGRIDDEVKVRGNRVNLGEVQSAMERVPGVRSAVVTAEQSESHGTRLTGYFIGASVSSQQLGAQLAQRIPAYMIPASFIELDALPLTASGKLDRRALPRQCTPGGNPGTDSAPRSLAEIALVEVFSSVLGLESVGVHDDFFAIGGDSILALSVRNEAEKRGMALDVEELFARPTVAEIATTISQAEPAAEGVAEPFALLPLIDRAALHTAEDAFPATSLQLGMVFHSIERGDSTMYKDVFRYRLGVPWDEVRFSKSFDRLVARHPALRSSFELSRHSVPVQVVSKRVPRTFDVATQADETAIREYIAAQQRRDYDFSGGPLYGLRAFVGIDTVDLVFAFHHAILDGWSVANLIRELMQDYMVGLGMDIAPVTSEPYPTTILAEYSRLEREAGACAAAQQFWRAALAGSKATSLDFYGAHEPPTAADPDVTYAIPQWLQAAAEHLGRSRRVPLKSVLLAAHCITLQRLSGEPDITTGLVTHGRPDRRGAEGVAGMFLNTIPFRLDNCPATWIEVVDRVVQFERASYRYRRCPLQVIQADAGRPVFNTAFSFVNYHLFSELASADGVELLGFEAYERTNLAALVTAAVDPRTGRLSLRVIGDRAALTITRARQYAETFTRILTEIVRSPEQPSDFLSDHLADCDVAQLISQRAAGAPEATALVADTASWTYAELDGSSERIAIGLLQAGMPPGARVGVMLERSPELIATVLGVLKAGAAVVPLDPSLPRARINAMIDRARPFRVISDIAEVLAPMETQPMALLPRIDPESTAYVLFTSGSTGEPKGVAMPHRALTNLITWQNRRPSGAVGCRTLQFFPLSFDVSFQEIFSTLCGGGALRLAPESARKNLRSLVDLVVDEKIERVFLPCGALQAFAEIAHVTQTELTPLRVMVNVGEQLKVTPEIRALCSANTGLVLENHYGPTETHEVASYTLTGPPEGFPALPPIGTAIDGVTISLLDSDLRPVPPGTRGEICIGGSCLASGYEGRPDLTAERFVTIGDGGRRVYRTGDLGVMLASGDLVYLGRADTQVKVRGFRVECAEIELALMALNDTAIVSAAVVARNLSGSDAILIAYLIGDRKAADPAAIRARLRTTLPDYMIPVHYRWLDEFPLTPSGKRDDRALRELPLSTTGAPPTDPAVLVGDERAVADIMAEFAGTEFAADTDFFEAGGTSIGAMRVVMAIERVWGVEIPLDTFVTSPTPARLAALIMASGPARPFDPIVALRTTGDRPPLFLVHPIGGNAMCYLDLVKHLPIDQPVYALQAAGIDPGAAPLRSTGELAASYVAAIRKSHPSGPYNVGGWSFGGYVAIEMARILPEADLAHLVLLDTIALSDGPRSEISESDLAASFFTELLWSARGMTSDPSPTLSYDGNDPDALFDSILHQAIDSGIVPPDSSSRLIRRLYNVFRANYEAGLSYQYEPLDRDLTLLKSAERMPARAERVHRLVGSRLTSSTNGWERLAPRSLSIIRVSGDHLSMMSEPHVADVAAKLEAALQ